MATTAPSRIVLEERYRIATSDVDDALRDINSPRMQRITDDVTKLAGQMVTAVFDDDRAELDDALDDILATIRDRLITFAETVETQRAAHVA